MLTKAVVDNITPPLFNQMLWKTQEINIKPKSLNVPEREKKQVDYKVDVKMSDIKQPWLYHIKIFCSQPSSRVSLNTTQSNS